MATSFFYSFCSCDTYQWLADRLDMPYRLFMPASDEIWGNAILSKYPLALRQRGYLPRMGAPLRRSFLLAEVDLRGHENIQENIFVLSTHVHHIKDGSLIRKKQIEAILKGWGGSKRTLVMGDFNATSNSQEIALLDYEGLIDTQAALVKEDQFTWVHYASFERIDYIWVTPILILQMYLCPIAQRQTICPLCSISDKACFTDCIVVERPARSDHSICHMVP